MDRILIIDDDNNFCSMLTRALKLDNSEIICAYTLTEGLQLAYSGWFDVVFLDVRLREGNGLKKNLGTPY